jgi:6-phospho-beta-glucosidase
MIKTYEKHAVKAGLYGDYNEAVRALLIHPLANDYNQIERALDELLKAHRDYLPQFSSNGANLYRRLISIS